MGVTGGVLCDGGPVWPDGWIGRADMRFTDADHNPDVDPTGPYGGRILPPVPAEGDCEALQTKLDQHVPDADHVDRTMDPEHTCQPHGGRCPRVFPAPPDARDCTGLTFRDLLHQHTSNVDALTCGWFDAIDVEGT